MEHSLLIAMNEAEFIDTVRRDAQIESEEEARDVTAATLQTLGERITDGEASDLARQLPDGVAELLTDTPGEADPFSLEEFTTRVSDRAEVGESTATARSRTIARSRAVASALETAAADELETAREQLPSEFDVIFEPGGPITMDGFLETVQERADLDSRDAAESTTTATLRTLSEPLSAGEAADLALYLPDELEDEIVGSDDEAAAYSVDEFVQHVSQRESVEKEVARTHAQAVCSVLAETASEREIGAAKKQLPDPFGGLFEPPDANDDS